MTRKQRKLPLYVQIKNKMVTNVREGIWKPGKPIPSESQLMELFNVSRTTIRQSIRDLVQNGILETRRGAPTKVREVPQENMSNPGIFHHETGNEMSVKVLRAERLKENHYAKSQLNLQTNQDVFFMERLRIADGLPIAYQQLYVPLEISDKISEFAGGAFDIFPKLGEQNIHYKNIKESVSASNATQYEADLLGLIPGEALIDILRTTIGMEDLPIEHSRTKYITRSFHYQVEIGR